MCNMHISQDIEKEMNHAQLQQGQIRIAVVGLVLALLRHIVLEDCCRLWIVSVQTIEYGVDMLWSIRSQVEGNAHPDRCSLVSSLC